jgi:sugar/nucleoside kinase (ribokinase family)
LKRHHLCGMGNAIVDLFVEVPEAEFETLGFERGTMRLVDADEQRALLDRFADSDPRLVSGGSVGNSTIAFAQLGGKAAYLGCVGDDKYGFHYQSEFQQLKIEMGAPVVVNQPTGTCAAIITPDAERTMRTCLGVAAHLSGKHVRHDRALIEQSAWLFIEGYLLSNNEPGQEAVKEAIAIAKEHGTKVALTCSDAFIVHVFGTPLLEALAQTDLFFCNATEACAVANATDAKTAFAKIADIVPNVVVTDGPDGAYIRWAGAEYHVPAFPCEPKDLTGAGDMFAGAFLYGITHGLAADVAARGANYLAMRVISQIGARLHTGVVADWKRATAG